MAYRARSGDIISLDRSRDTETMTISVPLGEYTGKVDPLTLWRTQPSIRTVIDFIAHNLGGIPLAHYRSLANNDREKQRDSAIARMLRRPAPGVTAYQLRTALMTDRLIHDRFVALIDESVPGRLSLVRIPAQLTKVLTSPLGQPTGVRVQFATGAEKFDLPLSDVIFDIGYDPTIGTKTKTGYSTLYTLKDLAEEMAASGEYRKNLWRNGAQLPAVIERPATANGRNSGWNTDTKRRFMQEFAKYRAGGGKQGGIPILEDGMQLKKVDAFSPADTQYIEVRKLALAEAASAFRVPPELVGAREGNFSNIAAYREQLYQDVLGGWVMAFEQAHDIALADRMGDDEYIEANIDAKLRSSFTERTQALQSSVGAPWRTRNEARKLENLPAVEGGDELVTPLNVITGSLASPRDTAPKSSGGTKADTGDDEHPRAKRPDSLGTTEVEERALEQNLDTFWAAQADRLRASLEQQKARKALPPIQELLDWDGETAQLARLLRGRSKRIAAAGAWEVLDVYNPDSDGFDVDNMDAWLARAADTNAADWTQGVRSRTTTLVTSGEWESSLDDIAAWGLVGAFAAGWATQYREFGKFDAASKSGLGTKTWRTGGRNPRPSHAAIDGQTVQIGDVFGNGLRWPGDVGKGDAEEVANCRCSVTYGTGS